MMSPALMFWIQFVLVLGAILIGIRRGGVALGLIGGLGVSVLVLGFRVAPVRAAHRRHADHPGGGDRLGHPAGGGWPRLPGAADGTDAARPSQVRDHPGAALAPSS